MNERERLTDLILNAPKIEFPFGSRAQGKTYQTAQNIADHLLANGVIVPSCKKGDIAYRLAHGYVEEEQVRCVYFQYLTNGYGFTEDDIGKVAFIGEGAKEEAEKALSERSVE